MSSIINKKVGLEYSVFRIRYSVFLKKEKRRTCEHELWVVGGIFLSTQHSTHNTQHTHTRLCDSIHSLIHSEEAEHYCSIRPPTGRIEHTFQEHQVEWRHFGWGIVFKIRCILREVDLHRPAGISRSVCRRLYDHYSLSLWERLACLLSESFHSSDGIQSESSCYENEEAVHG